MGTQDPDGSRAQVVKAIADVEGMRTHAGKAATKDSYHTERVEQLNKAGRAAIKEILAYVRKVVTATSGDPPSYLMELLGIAEHVGRTVMEAEGSPYAWSRARLDAVASDDFVTSGVQASTEQPSTATGCTTSC